MMIRDFFLPTLWRGRPLLSENRVGIYIDNLMVHVVYATASSSAITITGLEEYQINAGEAKTYHQRLGSVLKRIGPKIAKNSFITISYPSSKVVVKELTLPFIDLEKLKMVVEYEIEPVIPFKLENAVVDFVIVGQSEVKESSNLLVVAAQLEEVKKLVDIFHRSDIEIHQITVDVFGIANLFNHLPSYEKLTQSYVIVDVGSLSTRIGVISRQTLIGLRTINSGAHTPSDESEYSGENKESGSHLTQLFDEIAFTINSFELRYTKIPDIEKVFFIGPEQMYRQFEEFGKSSLHKTTEMLAAENIAAAPGVKTKISQTAGSWQVYSRAIGLVLDGKYRNFTLRKKEIEFSQVPVIASSLMMATALFAGALATIGGLGYLDLKEGKTKLQALERKEFVRLKKIFPDGHPGSKRNKIKLLANEAERYIAEQEEVWAAFSAQRLKPLEALQELGLLFNKKKYDLTIQQVIINEENKEQGPIEVIGSFKSKSGKEDFKHFNELEHDIVESKTLTLTEELDPKMGEKGGGVTFVAHFKQKEAE